LRPRSHISRVSISALSSPVAFIENTNVPDRVIFRVSSSS
jgi:hypothetical protein